MTTVESTTSPRPSFSPDHSLDLPSLQPLSHEHPLLSAPTFSADAFLLSRIHIPLEELRGELRSYLAILREELVQLINDDYEEFISLGTGLRGENERLRRLQAPLKDLGSEVNSVREVLVQHQELVQRKLDERAVLREERALLDLLQRLFETLTRAEGLLDGTDDEERSKLVQRVAGEYTQLVYLLGKAQGEGCKIVETVSGRIDSIRSKISLELSSLLLDYLTEPTRLRQVLKTYELIEGWEEAEDVIRDHFKGFCKATITSSCLVVPPSPMVPITPATPHATSNPFDKLSETTPLAALYNRIISQVETYQPLMTSAEELSDRFEFFAGVLWPEISTSVSEQLGSTIFSAGRPDELHKHYTTTHEFISLFENMAPSSRSISAMRASASYEAFERRWQLPVYFQLRWKEILSGLESGLSGPSTSSGEWALAQSAAAWKALSTCWDPEVYIPELSNRFWRLSLQISVRYGAWLRKQIEEGNEEDPAAEEQTLKMASAAVVDSRVLRRKIGGIEAIKENGLGEHLSISTTAFTEKIIEILTRRCTDSLKLVRSIASQLRATPAKQVAPTPSYFIPSILKPLHAFYTSRPGLRDKDWSTSITDSVMTSYAGILAGVRKTEDLLRRHRKSKKGGFSLFGGSGAATSDDGGGDEERFRKQMEVDINALRKDAESLDVDVESLGGWKELVEVVNRPAE